MTETQKIGELIKDLRIRCGLTQSDFAKSLKTSQSAVARIESGDQNLTLEQLSKISNVLGHPLVSISENWTDDYIINGGKKLSGSITISNSKNGTLGLIANCLLFSGTYTLVNTPRIESVFILLEIANNLGVNSKWNTDNGQSELVLKVPETFNSNSIDRELVTSLPSSFLLLPSLLVRHDFQKNPTLEFPKIGSHRQLTNYQQVLNHFGFSFEVDHLKKVLVISKNKKQVAEKEELTLREASDSSSQLLLLLVRAFTGTYSVYGLQENYMNQDLIGVILEEGGQLTREPSGLVIIKSIDHSTSKNSHTLYPSEDPVESFFFIALAAITGSEFTVKRVPLDFVRWELQTLSEMGFIYECSKEYLSFNGRTKLVDITARKSTLQAISKPIHAVPFPGINTDNLPLFIALGLFSSGTTTIFDWMNENRIPYYTELREFGAVVKMGDSHTLFVSDSRTTLSNTYFSCNKHFTPAILLALIALSINGKTRLSNIFALRRGFDGLLEKLTSLGADTEQVSSIL